MNSMIPDDKLDLILRRHAEITQRRADGAAGDFAQLSRELAELDPVVEAIRAYRARSDEIAGLEAMLAEPALDAEMKAMAAEERVAAEASLAEMAQALRLALLPKDADDDKGVILEVRAGTGGDQAAHEVRIPGRAVGQDRKSVV